MYYRWTSGWCLCSLVPSAKKGESLDILSRAWRQGRHDLITRGGAHACSSTSIFRFSALPSFCSQRCCPRRTIVDFLSQCRTMTTPHTTNSGTKFVAFQPVRCRVWHSKHLLYQYTLRFMASINQWFMCNRSYSCTSLDHDLRTTWARDFVRLHASLRECLKQTDRLYHCKKELS